MMNRFRGKTKKLRRECWEKKKVVRGPVKSEEDGNNENEQ